MSLEKGTVKECIKCAIKYTSQQYPSFWWNRYISKNLSHLQKPVAKDEIPNKNESILLLYSTPALILGTVQQAFVSSNMNKTIVIYGNVQFIWLYDV